MLIETRTIEQLPEAVSVPEDAMVPLMAPDGPMQRISLERIFLKYLGVGAAKETKAALDADLDHEDKVLALVYADPTPGLAGYYVKTGASGAGAWAPSTLYQGAPGEPGANVMAISTFALIPSLVIAAGTDRIRTKDGVDYVYDAAVDAAYVAANPLTAKISANGRGWRLATNQTITPYMFGAGGDVADNSAALQAFFDFLEANNAPCNMSGYFEVQNGFTMGGEYGDPLDGNYVKTGSYPGTLVIKVTANIEGPVITNNLHLGVKGGKIIGYTEDHQNWYDRLYDYGILFQGSAQQQTWEGGIFIYPRIAGVLVQTGHTPGENTFANDLGQWFTYGCGSGATLEDSGPIFFNSTPYSAITRTGAAGNFNQRTVFEVTTQPPESVTSGEFEIPLKAVFGGEVYDVDECDPEEGTVTLYPWVRSDAPASGTLYYLFGGGGVIIGSDAGCQSIEIAGSACASPLVNAALYPAKAKVISQYCGLGYVCGAGRSAAMVGGGVELYAEGNIEDILWNASPLAHGHTIFSEQALSLKKVRFMRPRRADNSWAPGGQPERLLMNYRGVWHRWSNSSDGDGNVPGARVSIDKPDRDIIAIRSNNPTIAIHNALDENGTNYLDYNRVFGNRMRYVLVSGFGTNREATGPLTVNVEDPTHKINGGVAGASATFTGFSGIVTVLIELDPTDHLNWLVSIVTGLAKLSAGSGANIRSISYAAAEPASGVFAKGDIIFSSAVNAGGSSGWQCTTAGTAGSTAVFKALANVAA